MTTASQQGGKCGLIVTSACIPSNSIGLYRHRWRVRHSPNVAQEARGATHERRAILIPSHGLLVRSQVRKLNGANVAASVLAITTCLVKNLYLASRPDIYGVLCHVCLGDGYHTSSCTTPARTNHMAGSAREPERQSICTSDTWKHRDSTEPELATSCLPPLRLGGAHDAHDPLPSNF